MTTLLGRNTLLPTLVDEVLDSDNFFNRSILDVDGDMLPWGLRTKPPSANIIESEKDYHIELAAPGLEKKDFKIEMESGVLSISAEKKEEKKEEGKNFSRREFSCNSFCRSFALPENLLTEKIEARYDNGILRLSLPKKEITVSKPKKEIKVS